MNLKKYFHEIAKIKTGGHALALGAAIGTFISVLPTPGFNILLGAFVILLFPKVSKVSLFAALLFWNPFFVWPLYGVAFKVGTALFGTAPVQEVGFTLLDQVYNYTLRFLVGNVIVAACMAILIYLVVFIIARTRK